MKETFIYAIQMFCRAINILILVRIILSWIPGLANNSIGRLVYSLTEPILGPIRSLISKSPLGGPGMIIDFSPMIAIFAMEIVRTIAISVIISL